MQHSEIPRGSSIRPRYLLEASDDGELLLRPNDVKLSACLIVRDNEDTIRPCLESLKPWVDEIVVVDTGSLDGTPQICEELGPRAALSLAGQLFAGPERLAEFCERRMDLLDGLR
uniref:CAZy families GT2 protein n=1 Tax=uncultured Planctomyces sp. TaxID=179110 RepID=A0A060C6S4_9PLAN|nr:CAZy families GT2 protein [uncultured Planctomyces sp.]